MPAARAASKPAVATDDLGFGKAAGLGELRRDGSAAIARYRCG